MYIYVLPDVHTIPTAHALIQQSVSFLLHEHLFMPGIVTVLLKDNFNQIMEHVFSFKSPQSYFFIYYDPWTGYLQQAT